jgi:hypothetical protein
MIDTLIAASLSQVLAQNYLKDVVGSGLKTVLLGGIGYVSVKLVDEHIVRKKK